MYQICFDESRVYTEINMMHTSRSIEILTKLKVAILTSIVLSFFSVSSFADYVDSKSDFGAYFSIKTYEERHPYTNEAFMQQDGWMIGIDTNSETYDSSNFYTFYRSKFAYGQVDYSSAGTGTMAGISDWQFETAAALGQGFEGQSFRTTPYAGIGFRYLLNKMGTKLSSTGHYGYDRASRYIYIPLGVTFETNPVNESFWTFRAEYDFFIYGQQTSYLSSLAGHSDITNDQDDGSGVKLSAKYNIDKNGGVEAFADLWDIADSKLDTTGTFMEPRNSTVEMGVRVFWSF